MIRPYPALSRAVRAAGIGRRQRGAGLAAIHGARPARPASLEQPHLVPSAGVRSRTPSWPSFAPRASTGPRTRSSGCSTSRLELLAEIIPLHRKLAERGQVELTTTPFYHPILPLLVDKRLARQAMPACRACRGILDGYPPRTPPRRFAAPSSSTAKVFGSKPVGMWPSEGSVSQAIIPRDCAGRHPVDRHRRRDSDAARPMAGLRATRRAMCSIPNCSIDPGGWKSGGQEAADDLSRSCT